jgi:hypothetical protein
VIAFLRFLGLMNAAVWFGAAVFFTFAAEPAALSPDMKDLIGTNNFPYFSVAIGDIIARRFVHLYTFCSVIALLYLVAEWLYLGKYPTRRWLLFIFSLILLGLLRGYWLQPTLRGLHDLQHARQGRVEERETAARAFHTWSYIAKSFDLALVGGLAFYVWRVGNRADPMRFIGASKFRS